MKIIVSGSPTLFFPLCHLCTWAASQHLFLHSSIFPSVHASQGDSPQRHLFLPLPLSTFIVESITGSWSVFPLNWASLWNLQWLTSASSLPSILSPTNPIVAYCSNSPYQSIGPDQMAPVALSTEPSLHPSQMANHSLNMGVSTPLPSTPTHTTLASFLLHSSRSCAWDPLRRSSGQHH